MKRLHATHAMWIPVVLCLPLMLMSCGGTDDPADISVDSGVATLEIRDKSELASTLIPVGTELILDAIAENKEGLNVTFGYYCLAIPSILCPCDGVLPRPQLRESHRVGRRETAAC